LIKKLDILVIKSFLGPFIAAFFITFFVLMLQNLWKYIDDLVGKGLDFATLGKFIWYISASMLTLAMPIAILISSIMSFGNLGESFELVAIKSSGISLLRTIRPLIFVALILCGITFIFANYVIPYATLKFSTLYFDIRNTKPTFDLKEGVFYNQLPGYAIKVGRKEADGKTIHDVVIYEQGNTLQDNAIVANRGIMSSSADKKFLEFTLYDGYRYQEQGNISDSSTEFIRLGFKEYKKLLDLSAIQKQTTPDSLFSKQYKMLSVVQLNRSVDSIRKLNDTARIKLAKEVGTYLHYTGITDSQWNAVATLPVKEKSFNTVIPDTARYVVYDKALETVNNIKGSIQFTSSEIKGREDEIRFREIEWHRKFSFSLACLVLFFIGAPLGSIIRKGGIGMPLVAAIVFFLIFHLLNMFGEKFVKENIAPAAFGMWLAVIVLIPIGFFLTYKAMHDSQLFNKEIYNKLFRKIGVIWRKNRRV
jgi:lipopolysaccharide export system permease protein